MAHSRSLICDERQTKIHVHCNIAASADDYWLRNVHVRQNVLRVRLHLGRLLNSVDVVVRHVFALPFPDTPQVTIHKSSNADARTSLFADRLDVIQTHFSTPWFHDILSQRSVQKYRDEHSTSVTWKKNT